jgi:hypothetical protein
MTAYHNGRKLDDAYFTINLAKKFSIGKDNRIDLSCVHRGDVLRRVGCETCNGNTNLKVYACEVHGECSFAPKAGVKVCGARCAERAPALT